VGGKTAAMIGLDPEELRLVRLLVTLLRHPDPSMPELTRQALLYLQNAAARRDGEARIEPLTPSA